MANLHQQRLLCRRIISILITLWTLYHVPSGTEAQDQRPLLPRREDNITATSNLTRDFTLPGGVTLSGTIRGADGVPVFFGIVIARSGDRVFTGTITFTGLSSTYRVVLPPGTYQLSVQRPILGSDPETVLFITSDLPGTVTVAGDTTRNIVVPATPAVVTVTGNVISNGTLPTQGAISFISLDGKIQGSTSFDRSYRISLPAGTYQVGVSLEILHPGNLRQVLTLRAGMVTLSNRPQTFNITLPRTVTLSGNVRQAGGAAAVPSQVYAIDVNDLAHVPGGEATGCGGAFSEFVATAGFVTVPEGSTTGEYRLTLPPASYRVTVNLDLDPREEVWSVLSFPPLLELNLTADRTQNFTVPSLPPFVTISGRVTDSSGQSVAEASISAFTSMVLNTPAAFSTRTQTDSNGRYELRVLSGHGYTLLVCPPQPMAPNRLAFSTRKAREADMMPGTCLAPSPKSQQDALEKADTMPGTCLALLGAPLQAGSLLAGPGRSGIPALPGEAILLRGR
ncbi:MAG: carboxypeptidase-like regulatory domain-containing protein [candidate division WOR-3 bacterium]